MSEASERLRAWLRDYGDQKQPSFVADLTAVLDELDGRESPQDVWKDIVAESRKCRASWGIGFPVISAELLRKYIHRMTGGLPSIVDT